MIVTELVILRAMAGAFLFLGIITLIRILAYISYKEKAETVIMDPKMLAPCGRPFADCIKCVERYR